MRDSISTASPDTPDPLHRPSDIAHSRESHQPPPYRPHSLLSIVLPSYSGDNESIDPRVPLVWPSVAKHQLAVNINITRLLFAVQGLCDKLDLWESSGSTRQEVKVAFARMSREWIRVRESLVECCAADMSDVEQGMNKTQQIIVHIINQGHSRGALKEALPIFQDTVREEVVNLLRAKIHPRFY
ncbi:hypothetical protein FRC06_003862 [Ceratobasidium sp. 370]|nr:hypothetical protein FRC06_003862 [Ceratobasidium sp. 370]